MTKDPLDAGLALAYCLTIFAATVGALQVAAAYSRLRKLQFVWHRGVSLALGVALFVGAFIVFLATGDRNVSGEAGGPEGSQQFGFSLLSVFGAFVVTAFLSSLLHRRDAPTVRRPRLRGLSALARITYVQAFASLFRPKAASHERHRHRIIRVDQRSRR